MIKMIKLNKTKKEQEQEKALSEDELKELKFQQAKTFAKTLEESGNTVTVIDASLSDEEILAALDNHSRKVAEKQLEFMKEDGIDKEDLN